MIDSLHRCVAEARSAERLEGYGLTAQGYGLVTLHRPALVDDVELSRQDDGRRSGTSRRLPSALPDAPTNARAAHGNRRPASRRPARQCHDRRPGFVLASSSDFELGARFVLTDSGGVQEETAALGVPCFTLRDTTERPVTIELGTNTLLGLDPSRIREIPRLLERFRPPDAPIPLWDGHAGERVASVLRSYLDAREEPSGKPAVGRPERSAGSR